VWPSILWLREWSAPIANCHHFQIISRWISNQDSCMIAAKLLPGKTRPKTSITIAILPGFLNHPASRPSSSRFAVWFFPRVSIVFRPNRVNSVVPGWTEGGGPIGRLVGWAVGRLGGYKNKPPPPHVVSCGRCCCRCCGCCRCCLLLQNI